MSNYQEVTAKLTNTHLNKLKPAVKNKTGTKLRLNLKTLKLKNCHMNCF